MKKFYFSTILLFVLISTSQAQWQQIQNIPVVQNAYCIDALGNDFAVIGVYPSQLLITKDAGKIWEVKVFPGRYPVDISVVAIKTFYAAAGDGTFYKTTDGGNSWTVFYSNPQKTGFGNYIEMFSTTDGIAMGDANFSTRIPIFLKTTDGISWFETNTQTIGGGAADGWRSLDFVNSNVGYYSPKRGPAPRKLYKTTDGGVSCIETNFDVDANVLKFYDENFGLLAHLPTIYRTTDGAVTWQDYSVLIPGFYPPALDIEYIPNNPNKIWMSYYNGLFFSNDSGKTWIAQSLPDSSHPFDIAFTNENTGWLLCGDGKLFYTNNNGGLVTNVTQEKNLHVSYQLFQNYPNPFNPETVIGYQLSVACHVTLKIYNLLGREVAILVNEYRRAGIHNSTFNINNYSLPSGIYFYRLTAGNYSSTQKMVLLK